MRLFVLAAAVAAFAGAASAHPCGASNTTAQTPVVNPTGV
jgi:hypothetical protein